MVGKILQVRGTIYSIKYTFADNSWLYRGEDGYVTVPYEGKIPVSCELVLSQKVAEYGEFYKVVTVKFISQDKSCVEKIFSLDQKYGEVLSPGREITIRAKLGNVREVEAWGGVYAYFDLILVEIVEKSWEIGAVETERTLGVKAGDWIKYEYVTITAAGQHPWVKLEIQKAAGTTVTVLCTTGVPSGASIPPDMPTVGLAVSWDITTGDSPYSYFIVHANPKIGDSVSIMGGLTLQVQGEDTRTYAGVSRTVVYASYSSFGLQNKYYWDKQTGVLVEYSSTMGGIQLTMKAVETNLWQASIAGQPLWIAVIVIVVIAIATITIAVLLRRRKPSMKEQVYKAEVEPAGSLAKPKQPEAAPTRPSTNIKYCVKCGANIPTDAIYCPKCGQKQP